MFIITPGTQQALDKGKLLLLTYYDFMNFPVLSVNFVQYNEIQKLVWKCHLEKPCHIFGVFYGDFMECKIQYLVNILKLSLLPRSFLKTNDPCGNRAHNALLTLSSLYPILKDSESPT